MPRDQFFRQRIFNGWGVEQEFFWPTDEKRSRVASVYTRTAIGLQKSQNPNSHVGQDLFQGMGGLIEHSDGLLAAWPHAGQQRRCVERQTPAQPQNIGIDDAGARTGHASGPFAHATLLSNGAIGWSGAYGTHFFVDPKDQVVPVFVVQTSNPELTPTSKTS